MHKRTCSPGKFVPNSLSSASLGLNSINNFLCEMYHIFSLQSQVIKTDIPLSPAVAQFLFNISVLVSTLQTSETQSHSFLFFYFMHVSMFFTEFVNQTQGCLNCGLGTRSGVCTDIFVQWVDPLMLCKEPLNQAVNRGSLGSHFPDVLLYDHLICLAGNVSLSSKLGDFCTDPEQRVLTVTTVVVSLRAANLTDTQTRK